MAERIQIAARRALAAELKERGANYEVIAEVVRQRMPNVGEHYGAYQAYRDVAYVLAQYTKRQFEAVEPLRELQYARLEKLHLAQWQQALTGDNDAFAKLMRVYEREARLMGLDKSDASGTSLPIPEVHRRSLLLLRVVQEWWRELAPSEDAYMAGLATLDARIQAAVQYLGLPTPSQDSTPHSPEPSTEL